MELMSRGESSIVEMVAKEHNTTMRSLDTDWIRIGAHC